MAAGSVPPMTTSRPAPADQPEHVRATRAFYDAIAEDYAAMFRDSLAAMPLDRAVMAGFAELVGRGAPVADVGCGPGRVTGYLASLGLDVHGVDLSESMLAIARRENPGLRFEQGSMLALDLPDGSLGASSPGTRRSTCLRRTCPRRVRRVPAGAGARGHLLLAFQTGDEPRRHERPWGHPVTLDFRRMRPERVSSCWRRPVSPWCSARSGRPTPGRVRPPRSPSS